VALVGRAPAVLRCGLRGVVWPDVTAPGADRYGPGGVWGRRVLLRL